ncbi:MAG TPA: hypothetical protein PLM14_12255 [Candidatus Hydrogenedentes bacterium]|mgnify:CR=1 FL=1|nr:hypothetical protein [Candidatus Hydrogenedentota bacterium]HQH52473.1 hypothetical protein [Candidatus Hydrogenedentota bacterium]
MSKLRISLSEKPLIEFLRRGGALEDPRGTGLVVRVIDTALQDEGIRRIATTYGFDAKDLCVLYAGMIAPLMPEPCINVSGPMLAATLPLLEPHRLEVMLSLLSRDLGPGNRMAERRKLILEYAEANAKAIWATHTAAYGEPDFVITPDGRGGYSAPVGRGCLGAVILGLSSSSIFAWILLFVFQSYLDAP